MDEIKKELVTNLEKHRARHAFRDRTNHFEEPEKVYKKTEVGSAIDPPLDIDCQETNIERMPLAEDKKKPVLKKEQYVEDLQAEIFDYCMRTEIKNLCKTNYFQSVQTEINEKMRSILIDWLVDVHEKFKMKHQTLFLTVNLIDRYLEHVPTPRSQLQLVGIAAIFMASKYEEIHSPDLIEFVKCCDNTYTAQQIIDVESNIILILNFNLVFTSAYHLFELFSQKIRFTGIAYHMALYLLYLSTLEFIMAKYRPSIIAMSAIYLSNKFLKLDMWHQDLPSVIASTEQEIKNCALDLFLLVQKARKGSLTAVLRKFATSKYSLVSQIQIKL